MSENDPDSTTKYPAFHLPPEREDPHASIGGGIPPRKGYANYRPGTNPNTATDKENVLANTSPKTGNSRIRRPVTPPSTTLGASELPQPLSPVEKRASRLAMQDVLSEFGEKRQTDMGDNRPFVQLAPSEEDLEYDVF